MMLHLSSMKLVLLALTSKVLVIGFFFPITAEGQVGRSTDANSSMSSRADLGAGNKIPLYLLGLFPMSGAWPAGRGCLPAVRMALEDVNKRPDLLPEHELVLLWNDTKCNIGVGINVMYSQLYEPPTKIIILGAGCSVVSEPTARASAQWNLMQLSYGSSSPALSDKNDYPRFIRTHSPESLMNPAKLAVMDMFNWNRVATIHQPTPLFSKDIDDFRLRLAAENMTLVSAEIISDTPHLQVQNLKKHDARIIVVAAYEEDVIAVLCEAYKAGMYGRRYVWFLADWFSPNWMDHKFSRIDCVEAQIRTLVVASVLHFNFQGMLLSDQKERGIAGMNAQEFRDRYFKLTSGKRYTGTDESVLGYESIWAAALGLNKTAQELQKSGKRLEDYKYTDVAMADLILKSTWAVEFAGVNGEVAFDANGDMARAVQIFQYRDGKKTLVGIYNQRNHIIHMYDEIGISWKDGVPKDATTFETVQVFVRYEIYSGICVVASIGIILALTFLSFNVYFRKERIIRMSSPVLNNVILIGCIVVYLTVFLQETSPTNISLLCKLRTLTIMGGFSLAFGALFAKTWRVYVIFTNTNNKRVKLHDIQLILMVSVLVMLDIIAFALREVFDAPQVGSIVVDTEERDKGDLIVQREILTCKSDYSLYFQAVVFIYKGLLLIFGAFLAWQTRTVNIPALNDSHYIGMCVYNVAVLSILGVVLLFALGQQVELQYALVSAFIIFATTIVQLTIFIPKVLKLYNGQSKVDDDDGATDTAPTERPTTSTTTTTHVSADSELQDLRDRLAATRKELANAKPDINKLCEINQV